MILRFQRLEHIIHAGTILSQAISSQFHFHPGFANAQVAGVQRSGGQVRHSRIPAQLPLPLIEVRRDLRGRRSVLGHGQLEQGFRLPLRPHAIQLLQIFCGGGLILRGGYEFVQWRPGMMRASHGPNQQSGSLTTVTSINTPCWNFDSSFDGKTIFYNLCTPGSPEGSSTVTSLPVGSTTASQVFSSSTLAINSVRVFDRTNAFLLATASNTGQGVSGDRSKDGLYKISTDGSNNFIPLTQTINGLYPNFSLYSQYFWSNVSRDGSLYALEESGTQGSNFRYVLLYGSMNGGATHTFADIADGTQLEIAGWTTM